MATHLYRLGGWAFERRRSVLVAWIAVLAVVLACGDRVQGPDERQVRRPGHRVAAGAGPARAEVPRRERRQRTGRLRGPGGREADRPDNRAAVRASVAQATGAAEVSAVTDPFETKAVSHDGRIGFADVIYPVPADEIEDASRDELEAVADPARDAGLQVDFGGRIVTEHAEAGSEGAGMMIGYVVLAITLGSLLAAGLPLLTAIIGVGIGVVGLTALSGVVELSETAPTLATMLGLAVGIDYALFIISRHRQNLGDGMELRDAAAQATATAGSAVVFAGHDRGHRAGRPRRRRHPVPHRDGPRRRRHRRDRGADRAHAGARAARLRRRARHARQPRARLPAGRPPARRSADDEHPLGALRDRPAVAGAARRTHAARRRRAAGVAHEARAARRRLAARSRPPSGARTTC